MRVDWTGSGGCTNGSTAPPRGATRRVSGGAATTSTGSVEPDRGCRWRNRGTGDLATQGFRASFPASLLRRLGAALRRQRGGDDRLVRVHVGDGRDADARRLDDVDGVDADARTDVAQRRGVVPGHVGRDDGSDDAAVPGPGSLALPPGAWQDGRGAPRWAGHTACASASTAAIAAPASPRSCWSSGSWTCARWRSWRRPSPSNVSHRAVSAPRAPSGPSSSGQG